MDEDYKQACRVENKNACCHMTELFVDLPVVSYGDSSMSKSESMKTAFESAVSKAGGQSELSRKLKEMGLSFSQQRLWHHLRVKGLCPIELVIPLEKLSGVGRHELRADLPELFPSPGAASGEERREGDRRNGERRFGDRRQGERRDEAA
ncbi:hypothetical protein [Stutzerimonas nitrititolerans]|uniref:hypothetical protein n=1 Tax=Stutzerimonas nitrititolerans TaxID=2482751 RepID=UPI003AA8C0DF